jgi:hypothetical protein
MPHLAWLSLALALYTSQQPVPAGRTPPMLAAAVKQIEPPQQPGGWVLQVLTRGGLDGRGTGDLFVRSSGGGGTSRGDNAVTLSHVSFVPELDQSIRSLLPSPWTAPMPAGICSDCIVTLMHLAVRGTDGSVQTYSVNWNPTTQAQVPPELMRIHDLALKAVAVFLSGDGCQRAASCFRASVHDF